MISATALKANSTDVVCENKFSNISNVPFDFSLKTLDNSFFDKLITPLLEVCRSLRKFSNIPSDK